MDRDTGDRDPARLELRTPIRSGSSHLSDLPRTEPDPLSHDDILAECDIQRLSVDMVSGSAAAILDLKGSLYFDDANVAVLSAEGTRTATWSGSRDRRPQKYQTFYVGASHLTGMGARMWRMWLGAIDGQELVIDATSIGMWLGNVSWGDAAPPLYDEESDDAIERGLYQWSTIARPVSWTSTDLL